MIVCKFGGSSLANAEQFEKVKNIIQENDERRIIVASACGKAHVDDNKITDLLYLLKAHIDYSVAYDDLYKSIEKRFLEIEEKLNLNINIKYELDNFKYQLSKHTSVDYIVSRGEYFTSKLLAAYLGFAFVDAKDVIRFNYDLSIDFENTEILLKEALNKYGRIVVPGFYGAMSDLSIKVMSRGGSDVSGSILANVINAKRYENYTDVSGILMVDPHIIDNPKEIEKITYNELRELSYMGANVLHEDAIYPVKNKNIPIYILNTNIPSFKGTMICESIDDENDDNVITGIAGKENFSVISIYCHNSSNEVGILKKALEVFEKYNISIEHVPSGIDNFSLVVSSLAIERCLYELIADLKKATKAYEITINNDLALIAVVGRNMAKHIGASAKIFNTLANNNINIRMINQGSDEINIIIGVMNSDFKKAIKCLYNTFIGE